MNMKNSKIKYLFKEYTVVFVLIVLSLLFYLGNPAFLKMGNIITILRQSSILGICAMGMMTLVIVGELNLSMGATISLTTVVIATLVTKTNIPWPLAMILSLLMTTIIGFLTGMIVVKTKIVPMIGTIALSTLISGIAYIIVGGLPVSMMGQSPSINWFYRGDILGLPVPIIIWLIVILIFMFIYHKTYYGRHIFASGSNAEAARLSGINTDFIKISVYTLAGTLCGMAGILMLGRMDSGQPNSASTLDMDVLSAVIIGGVSFAGGEGKISKAVSGIILISALRNGMTLNGVDDYVQMVVTGAVFLAAVILDAYQQRKRN